MTLNRFTQASKRYVFLKLKFEINVTTFHINFNKGYITIMNELLCTKLKSLNQLYDLLLSVKQKKNPLNIPNSFFKPKDEDRNIE